ncbi:ABC transporter permease [Roseovarius sp. SK2]|jgi:putative spermidine/putrescine transport system permease protein|uniref:ABC transporter permease n=1 Tax=Roseovarius TaxID=74030 RepID=UPI000CDDB04B|nr:MULTISPECIES: ABC transporter permease [Roseovarius]MDD9724631.1 ABC transporter permease [Roseovarius sp. SK2]
MRDFRQASIFVTPAAIIAICISALPLLYIFYTSVEGPDFSLGSYISIIKSTLFHRTLSTTMVIAVSSSALSLLIGYVIALHLARQPAKRRAFLLILVLLPFWTSVLVKCYAFTIILGRTGIINSALDAISGGQLSMSLLLNRTGVLIGMTNYLTPFVVFPVLASLLAIDPAVYRSASIMGARPARIFWTVTLPMSVPGIIAALASVFVMALSFFIIPALLGGPRDAMLSNLVDFYTREALDWNTAAAIGMILLGMTLIVVGTVYARNRRAAL